MKGTLNIPWKRYALIVELACRLREKSSQFGKTALQKMVYLLQELYDIDCGYEFDFYTYGPFSSELVQDLDLVESMRGVKILPVSSGIGGYKIEPGERSEALKNKAGGFLSDSKVSNSLDNLVKAFGNYSARELELRSTIIYVARDLKCSSNPILQSDLARIVKEIKPKFTDVKIQEVITEMLEKGYLSLE